MNSRLFKRSFVSIILGLCTLLLPFPSSAQTLTAFPLASNPPDEGSAPTTPRPRQKGRKGLIYKYQSDFAAFPIDVSGATARLKINTTELQCQPGFNPPVPEGGCAFVGLNDAVKIFYNGDFNAGDIIQYWSSEVRSYSVG